MNYDSWDPVKAAAYNNQLISFCAFPCSSLLSLIRKRRDISGDIPLVVQDSAKTPGTHQTSTKCSLCIYMKYYTLIQR